MKKLLFFFLLLLAVRTPAAAQDAASGDGLYPPPGAVTAGVRGVWYAPADGERETWNPGVQLRYHLSRFLGLEGSADYQRHVFPRATAHTAALQASVLAYLYPGRFSAFLIAGAGFYPTRLEADDYRRNLGRFAPHAGAGAQVFLTRSWSADLTYRHVFIESLDVRDNSAGTSRTFKRSGEQLGLALNYRLGGD